MLGCSHYADRLSEMVPKSQDHLPLPCTCQPPDEQHYINKATVDHTSPALCTPIIPSSNGMACSAAAWRHLQQMHYNALSMGRKTPKIPFPLGFCHPASAGPSHGHRQGNMCKKFGNDRACGSTDIRTDRQTQTHRHYWLWYFATAATGEVINSLSKLFTIGKWVLTLQHAIQVCKVKGSNLTTVIQTLLWGH